MSEHIIFLSPGCWCDVWTNVYCDVQVIHAAIFYGEIFPDGSRGFER